MPRLRAAIVGAGLMGGWHARYAARAGARIAAIVEPRPQAASPLLRRFPSVELYTELEACLARVRPDVVHICTAPELHAVQARAALEAGAHVLVEKPAFGRETEARELASLARSRGRLLCPVHQLPFQRGCLRLLQEIARLGELRRAEYVLASAGGEGLAARARRELMLGILPHPLSLFRRLLADGARDPGWRVLRSDADALELSGASAGASLSVWIGLEGRPPRHELHVVGSRATAHLDLFHGYRWIEERPASRSWKALAPFSASLGMFGGAAFNLLVRGLSVEPAYPGLRELIARFLRSAAEGGAPPIEAEEIIAAAALMEMVSQSGSA